MPPPPPQKKKKNSVTKRENLSKNVLMNVRQLHVLESSTKPIKIAQLSRPKLYYSFGRDEKATLETPRLKSP